MRTGGQVLVMVNMARRDVGQMKLAQPTGYELKVIAFVKGQANTPWGLQFTFADLQLVLYQDVQKGQRLSMPFIKRSSN
jgi:hypothetical protein